MSCASRCYEIEGPWISYDPNCPVHGDEARARDREATGDDWVDAPLPEDEQIKAAHPTRTGRHATYANAMRLVGARRSKGGLVELVNWLLSRAEEAEDNAALFSTAAIERAKDPQ